jgi:hypothetical protein
MADLQPNDLIKGLVGVLTTSGAVTVDRKLATAVKGNKSLGDQEQDQLATTLASLPDLVTFAGFVGGVVDDTAGPTKKSWLMFYLDAKLLTWLLVEKDAVVFRDKLTHDGTAGGERDLIWVRADASVGRGSGSQSTQERFLRGEFTSARGLSATLSRGTLNAETGIFCDGESVGCCRRATG